MTIYHVSGISADASLDEIVQKLGAFVKTLPHETESFRFVTRAEVVDFMRADFDDMTLYLDVEGKDPAIIRSQQWPEDQVVARIISADVIRDIADNPAPEFICRKDAYRLSLNIARPNTHN
jgi:hypothetical protein